MSIHFVPIAGPPLAPNSLKDHSGMIYDQKDLRFSSHKSDIWFTLNREAVMTLTELLDARL